MNDECQQIRRWLDDYLSNELLVETNETVLRHLDECAGCREELGRRQNLRRLFRDAFPETAAPPALRERVVAEVAASVDSRSQSLLRRAWDGLRADRGSAGRRRAVLAVAALITVVLLLPNGTWAWVGERVRATLEQVFGPASERAGSAMPARPPNAAKDVALPAVRRVPPPVARSDRPAVAVLEPSELALLELEVLSRLDSVGALLVGGEVEVVRTGSRIEVRGLVEDAVRRRTIVEALAPVSHRAVRVNVRTLSEGLRELPPSSGPIQFRPLEFDAGGIPAASDLREHVRRSGRAVDVDTEVRRVATSALRHSRGALRHALAMESLAERYEAGALRDLNPKAYDIWMRLIATHANAFVTETRQLRELLEPVFVRDLIVVDDARRNDSSEERERANMLVPRLVKLAVTIDDVVRGGMTTSTERVERVQVREAEFWQTVRQAERLARSLAK